MLDDTTHTTTRRWTAGRIASVAAGAIAAVLAVGSLALGGFLLWADGEKDDDGYLATGDKSFATSTYALATENLDIDLDGGGWIMDRDEFGNVRVEVEPRGGKPVFVGIARTSDVSAYLDGAPHALVSDLEYPPFDASQRDRPGDRRPARPADQRFWAASAHGAGAQSITWDAQDGDWSVVVMNENASRTVDAEVSAGAKVPFLATAGWVSVGGGLVLLAAGSAALVLGLRRPRDRAGAPDRPVATAAA